MVNSLENYIRSVISPSSAAGGSVNTKTSELIIISHAMSNENNNKKNLWVQTHTKKIKQNWNEWVSSLTGGKLKKKV